MNIVYENVRVTANFQPDDVEIKKYVEDAAADAECDPNEIESIDLNLNKNTKEVTINYIVKGTPFERIRRITGYLVGSIDRSNDSKRAELRDRTMSAHA